MVILINLATGQKIEYIKKTIEDIYGSLDEGVYKVLDDYGQDLGYVVISERLYL